MISCEILKKEIKVVKLSISIEDAELLTSYLEPITLDHVRDLVRNNKAEEINNLLFNLYDSLNEELFHSE